MTFSNPFSHMEPQIRVQLRRTARENYPEKALSIGTAVGVMVLWDDDLSIDIVDPLILAASANP